MTQYVIEIAMAGLGVGAALRVLLRPMLGVLVTGMLVSAVVAVGVPSALGPSDAVFAGLLACAAALPDAAMQRFGARTDARRRGRAARLGSAPDARA